MKTSVMISIVVALACCSTGRGTRGGNGNGGTDNGVAAGPSAVDGGTGTGTPSDGGTGGAGGNCTVDQPQSTPLALPDTNAKDGTQKSCTTDASCGGGSSHCVMTADKNPGDGGPGFCATSYIDTLNFVGFAAGATLTDTTKLVSVCATLEHSFFGDLQIDLISPDGKIVALRQFIGRDLDTFFLGQPDYCDSDSAPVAGTGYKYCWTAAAPTKILTPHANNDDNWTCGANAGCESWSGSPINTCALGNPNGPPPYRVIPAGNYLPDVDFTALQGAQLNGNWTFRITDLWQIDNGFLFDWSIQFDSALVADCAGLIQ